MFVYVQLCATDNQAKPTKVKPDMTEDYTIDTGIMSVTMQEHCLSE